MRGFSEGCAWNVFLRTGPGFRVRTLPQAKACSSLQGDFQESSHDVQGGATTDENGIPSRDLERAVEAMSRAHPSLTAGARISVIFIVVGKSGGKSKWILSHLQTKVARLARTLARDS